MTQTELANEQDLVAEIARSYLKSFVDNEYLNNQEESTLGYESGRWKQICELGWTSLVLPESVGGSDGSVAAAGAIAREAGRAAFASPLLTTLRTSVVAGQLGHGKRNDQLMTRLSAGDVIPLVSPPDGALRAYKKGGAYALSGGPVIVEWLTSAHAVAVLVPCRDDDTWLFAALPAETVADRTEALASIDNERCARLEVEGVTVAPDDVVASDVSAADARSAFARAGIIRTAAMVGGAEAVLDFTSSYALQRHQFGQPIGAFQAVRHHLARMAISVDAARLSYEESVFNADRQPNGTVSAVIAQFVAGRSYVETVLTAAQVHGGIGTTTDHILHHHFRRAKALQLRCGKRDNRLREITEMLVCRREGRLW